MSAITLSLSQGGAPAGTQFSLHQLGSAAPRRFFRQVLYLRLNGDPAQMVFNPAMTTFNVRFSPETYNALNHPAPPLKGTLSKSGDHFVVQLNAPRRFNSLRVDPAPDAVRLHRLDGEALSEEPTLEFDYSKPYYIHYVMMGGGGPELALPASEAVVTDDEMLAGGAMIMVQPGASPGFVDQRFAVRLVSSGGSVIGTTPATGFSEINVRSYPTGPRVGVSLACQLDEAVFFWTQAGEHASVLDASLGPALAKALNAQLGRLTKVGQHDLALVIESDAECAFSIQASSIRLHQVLRTFSTGEPKHVMRFVSCGAQPANFVLPRAATVVNATVTAVESLRRDRPALALPDVNLGSGSATGLGTYIRPGQAAAQQVLLTEAINATGLSLIVQTLAGGTTLTVEVQGDWNGEPSGKVLALGKLSLPAVGRAVPQTLLFAQPVLLSSQPCWIVVRASAGAASWIAASGGSGLVVFSTENNGLMRKGELSGLAAAYTWLIRAGSSTGGADESTGLYLGAQSIAPTKSANGEKRFTLTAALTSYLAGLPADADIVTIPLEYTSPVSGLVTLKALEVEFEV